MRFHSPPYPIAPSATFFHLGKSPISPHFCTLLYHYRSLSPPFSVSLQSSVFSFQSSVSSLQSPLPLTRSLLQSETVAILSDRCCFALFSSELARGVWHKFSQLQLCSVHLVFLRLESWRLFRCVRLRFYRWIVAVTFDKLRKWFRLDVHAKFVRPLRIVLMSYRFRFFRSPCNLMRPCRTECLPKKIDLTPVSVNFVVLVSSIYVLKVLLSIRLCSVLLLFAIPVFGSIDIFSSASLFVSYLLSLVICLIKVFTIDILCFPNFEDIQLISCPLFYSL